MGSYLNPGNKGFRESLNSEIYVDKTGLIERTNAVLDTREKYVCVSRPRRFGKSMAADMLAAYYDQSVDSKALFRTLHIETSPSFRNHLNKYNVIKINMQDFLSAADSIQEMLGKLQKYIIYDLIDEYATIRYREKTDLVQVMKDVYTTTKHSFVILIDEWDCLFREYQQDQEAQKKYLDFLRMWLKDKEYVSLAYMTGILPIKKYGTHSALNMFSEYSMINPREMGIYFGFTEPEVKKLCTRYRQSFEETQAWYDGYEILTTENNAQQICELYSPKSVVEAMKSGIFDNYWNQTETYEALKIYIQMNFDGLKDAIIQMLAGERIPVNTGTFSNDMTTFQCRDDVLTLLIHLGYLGYHWPDKTVFIPNKEIAQEYINAISTMGWNEVMDSILASKNLLEALWSMDENAVAKGIDQAHSEISILQYNDENSLSCTIHLAFYFAREYYTIIRELPTGKGFADICFLPRKLYADKPAVIIELKWDRDAHGAIAQIRERRYPAALKDYHGNLILAGISYDKKTKRHSCLIEKLNL